MKYKVSWKTLRETSTTVINIAEIYVMHIFDDVQFKDRYIKATDDSTGKRFRIPYTSIYDIEDIGDTPIEEL